MDRWINDSLYIGIFSGLVVAVLLAIGRYIATSWQKAPVDVRGNVYFGVLGVITVALTGYVAGNLLGDSPTASPADDQSADSGGSTTTAIPERAEPSPTSTVSLPTARIRVAHWAICDCGAYWQVKTNIDIENTGPSPIDVPIDQESAIRLLLGPPGRDEQLSSPWTPVPASRELSLVHYAGQGQVVALSPNLPNQLLNSGDYVTYWNADTLAPGETYFEERSIPTPGGPRGSDLVFNIPPGEVENILGLACISGGRISGVAPLSEWEDQSHGATF